MIFDSGQSYSGRAHNDAMAAAHAHAVPIVVARRGMRWTSGDGVTLDILAPSTPFLADTGDDVNENSIVTRLSYNDGGTKAGAERSNQALPERAPRRCGSRRRRRSIP
jgi:beta-lactamase superfamily II metal-dependent hydrolase